MGYNLAILLIWGWVPIILAIFAVMPPKRAVVFSFVLSWLLLPNLSFNLPGLPDWGKVTACVVGTMIGALTFDAARVFSFRPRWYDIPMAVWCLSPFVSSMTTGQGPYDGISAILSQIFWWGMPYLLGRIYLSDAEGARLMLLGIAVGGLIYAPFCLFEVRMSPILRGMVYGIPGWEGQRFGGYRPAVFLSSGLELGMWMTLASFAAQRLWATGAVTRLWGYPFGWLTLALVGTTILCKSTGALVLLMLGLSALWATRFARRSWPVWLLLALPPMFCLGRTTGYWSGASAVEIARATVGEDRAQSLGFRFECEENHIVECMKKPFFGYSRASDYMKGDKVTSSIVDGFWIITLGSAGLVGLVALNLIFVMPMALTALRFPSKTWTDPEIAPVVALGIILVLFMIDCLSNGMINPIYALVTGGVTGMGAIQPGSRTRPRSVLARAIALDEQGRPDEAIAAYDLAIDLATAGRGPGDADDASLKAEALTGLARCLGHSGHAEEAEKVLREALDARLALVANTHDVDRLADLAAAHEELARLLAGSGRVAEAIVERRKGLDLREAISSARPRDPECRAHRVEALNDLAWLLAAGPSDRDPEAAVALATEAARLDPENPACWNTLGVARYRSGDWAGALEALEHSVVIGPQGGTAFDHYFLAMASLKVGEVQNARAWFDNAVAWSDRHRPDHAGLASFRAEAAALLVGTSGRSITRQ